MFYQYDYRTKIAQATTLREMRRRNTIIDDNRFLKPSAFFINLPISQVDTISIIDTLLL